MTILQPGTYLIELESDRPFEHKALGRVLSSMGFSRVVPDQMPEGPSTGALPGMAAARSTATATSAPSTMRLSTYMMQPGTTAPAVAKPPAAPPPPPPKPVAPPPKPVAPAAVRNPYAVAPSGVAQTKRVPTAAVVNPNTKLAEHLPRYQPPPAPMKKVATAVNKYAVAPEPKKKQEGRFSFGPSGPGGGGGAPPPPDPGYATPEMPTSPEEPGGYDYPTPDLGPSPPSEGWGGYGGEGGGYSPGGGEGYSNQDTYEASADTPQGSGIILALWQAWREYGSPFAGASTSGESQPTRIRLLAELKRPLQIQQASSVKWASIIPITLPVFNEMSLQLTPFQMVPGVSYEMRFLSRSKTAPSREQVEALLARMGWSMKKLTSIKKHMRLPGRGGANVTLWYGIGTWTKPRSVVVADDPFYFEDLREAS